MRGREFIMKDAYSFHADEKIPRRNVFAMYKAYTANYSGALGLDFRAVMADSGNIGGSVTHEFHVLADSGEDTIAFCGSCDYAANIEKAATRQAGPASVPADALQPPGSCHSRQNDIEDDFRVSQGAGQRNH